MDHFIRYMINTKDRKGMVLDVIRILYRYRINISSLEVQPGVIYIKVDNNFNVNRDILESSIYQEKDVIKISQIPLLPQEEKEKYIETVLDATDEGIIATDKYGTVTTINRIAKQILKINNVIGKHISEVIAPKLPILDTIKTGKKYDHMEIRLDHKKTSPHYFASARPILDESGGLIGSVSSIIDIEKVKNLAYSYHRPSMITFDEIIGESKGIKRVINMAKKVSKSDSTVLIKGESGTGKELFARSIHMASARRNHPFVAVNCGALPGDLLESELFGYEEGAFTGARKGGKPGLFTYADTGTLFLDEIGELPIHLQVKLLRVLQENKVRPIGGNEEIPINVRVIAVTNKNLEELIEKGQFREDLYYRLNVFPIVIPPLRERKEDILILSRYYISKLSPKINKKIGDISNEAMEKMIRYHWPGNVRELENIIERSMNLCESHIIRSKDIIIEDQEDVQIFCEEQRKQEGNRSKYLKEIVIEAEKKAIIKALKEHKSIRKVAKSLGVSHGTIINKIKAYDINRKEWLN